MDELFCLTDALWVLDTVRDYPASANRYPESAQVKAVFFSDTVRHKTSVCSQNSNNSLAQECPA